MFTSHRSRSRQRGQGVVEYGVLLALVIGVLVLAIPVIALTAQQVFSTTNSTIGLAIGNNNSGGDTPGPTAPPEATPPPGCPDGQYQAEYFANMTMSGAPVQVGCESTISYDWGFTGPGYGLGGENFSARWNGNFNFPTSTLYAFTVAADDGVRVYVDNTLLIDYWVDQSGAVHVAGLTLSAGVHTVRLEYYENLQAAGIQLDWAPMVAPDAPLWQGAIPSSTSVLIDWVMLSPGAQSIVLYDDAGVQVAITSAETYQLLEATGLSPNTEYFGWYLVARNQAGDSLPSDPFSFMTGDGTGPFVPGNQ